MTRKVKRKRKTKSVFTTEELKRHEAELERERIELAYRVYELFYKNNGK